MVKGLTKSKVKTMMTVTWSLNRSKNRKSYPISIIRNRIFSLKCSFVLVMAINFAPHQVDQSSVLDYSRSSDENLIFIWNSAGLDT